MTGRENVDWNLLMWLCGGKAGFKQLVEKPRQKYSSVWLCDSIVELLKSFMAKVVVVKLKCEAGILNFT